MDKKLHSMFHDHPRVTMDPKGPSRAKQSFAEESEINNIVDRYQKRGIFDHAAKYGGTYDQMPGPDDFHQAMNLVTEAQQMFEELPSNVRTRFRNDPGIFLDFVGDPANEEEMIQMELIKRPERSAGPPEAASQVETTANAVVDPPPEAASEAPEGPLAQSTT